MPHLHKALTVSGNSRRSIIFRVLYTIEYLESLTESKLAKTRRTFSDSILLESKEVNEWSSFTGDQFDIFLSHSYLDKKIIYGVYLELSNMGYSVYLDWIKDPELDRTSVSTKTASQIRQRIVESSSLFYATTDNAKYSNWMPWELGFSDGYNHKVAILPLIQKNQKTFARREYLELYPYIDKDYIEGENKEILWVCNDPEDYIPFNKWINKEL